MTLAWGQKAAVEGKIGSEGGELAGHFGRAAVGVQEETARRPRGPAQCLGERAPGFEAVNRDRQVAFGGEAQLPDECLSLLIERRTAESGQPRIVGAGAIKDPAIEADFADRGVRVGVERAEQCVAPVRRRVADIPRVQAIAGPHPGKTRGKGCDGRPVGLAGAVDDAASDSGCREVERDALEVWLQPLVLQMIVGVEKQRGGRVASGGEVRE